MVRVSRIVVYPVKSFDGLEVEQARVLPSGCLENDRRFALITEDKRVVNGKRTERVHPLVLSYHSASRSLSMSRRDIPTEPATFHIDADREELELWLSTYFDEPVSIIENATSGFPDDPLAPGPTFISAETLQTVASWYDGLTLDENRRRFRANIELAADDLLEGEPFWEDRLFASVNTVVRFRIGEACFDGTNPCARCVVPMRDSRTGELDPEFKKTFKRQREMVLPAWAERNRFDHFYRLAVNTRPVLPAPGATIRVGDALEILGTRPLESPMTALG